MQDATITTQCQSWLLMRRLYWEHFCDHKYYAVIDHYLMQLGTDTPIHTAITYIDETSPFL